MRLPVWLGGDKDDASAFREYSAIDLSSHCLIKYWPQEYRQFEDPCSGNRYRVYDGYLLVPRGSGYLSVPDNMGLPELVISSDESGYLYVEPPVWSKYRNGAIGFGREISADKITKLAIIVTMRTVFVPQNVCRTDLEIADKS